jgi:hypothetical protein
MIMNSWKSIGASLWAPPFTIFIIGTGRLWHSGPEVFVERYSDLLRAASRGQER